MKQFLVFLAGVGAVALLFGALSGLAHSPTAAGVLAIAGSGASLFLARTAEKKRDQKTDLMGENRNDQLRLAGVCMLVFSPCFALGLTAGIAVKFEFHRGPPPPRFAWLTQKSAEPLSAYEAVDWIIVAHKLRAMGYSDDAVAALYALREKSPKPNLTPFLSPEAYRPISDLLNKNGITKPAEPELMANEPSIQVRRNDPLL